MIKIHIHYFAYLAEISGKSIETIEVQTTDAAQIFEQIKQKYDFKLNRANCSLSINAKFAPWTQSLSNEDHIVFMPPFAGG